MLLTITYYVPSTCPLGYNLQIIQINRKYNNTIKSLIINY